MLGNDKILMLFYCFIFVPLAFMPFMPNFSLNTSMVENELVASFSVLIFYISKEKFYIFLTEIWRDIKQFKLLIFSHIFHNAAAWFFYFLMIYLIAYSAHITQEVGFLYFSFGAALSLLAGLLPITFLGVGTRDAVFVFLLLPLGVPREMIILFSLLIMFNYISFFAICFYCWLKKPII